MLQRRPARRHTTRHPSPSSGPTRRAACLLATLFALSIPQLATAHPQDGPHADIRFRIDPDAVSLDVTMNLVWIDDVCPALREAEHELHPIEEASLQEAVESFFRDQNRVTIDGVTVSPRFDTFKITRSTEPALLALFPNTGARGLIRAHLEITYPSPAPPMQVGLLWAGYPPDFTGENPGGTQIIESQLLAESNTFIVRFSETEPEHTWHGTGTTPDQRFQAVPDLADASTQPRQATLPLALLGAAAIAFALAFIRRAGRTVSPIPAVIGCTLTLAAAGTGVPAPKTTLDDEQALEIFWPIHANIYRAFDYEDPSDVYDALARSVSGELLETLYAQIHRSLIMYEEGGAVSRISAVEPIDATVTTIGTDPDTGAPAFQVRARWQVEGSVYHWGHSHTRRNEYLADYTVLNANDTWRITANTVVEQVRLDIDNQLQPTDPADNQPIGEL